jgi:hypothetical protein
MTSSLLKYEISSWAKKVRGVLSPPRGGGGMLLTKRLNGQARFNEKT